MREGKTGATRSKNELLLFRSSGEATLWITHPPGEFREDYVHMKTISLFCLDMVRTLDSALLSSLNNVTRHPALTLTIQDHIAHYSPYQTPGTADAWNDVCIANDNSIVRTLVTRGGTGFTSSCLVQCITDPTQAAQWSTWTTLAGSAGLIFQDGGCAIANSAGTITAFAQRGTGGSNLWAWTSTNNGLTWTGPVSVLVPPGGALIRGIANDTLTGGGSFGLMAGDFGQATSVRYQNVTVWQW